MEVTSFGLIFIPVFIYFFFRSINKLFLSLVFFSQFTATSVINVTSITFGLQVSVFITILLFFYLFVYIFTTKGKTFYFNRSEKLIFIAILLFFLSIIFGFSLRGFNSNVSFFNFAQFIYLLFGFLISISVYLYLKLNPSLITPSLNVYILSGLFCSFWALYQLSTMTFGFEYSDFFNNSVSDAALKYDMTLDTGINRITSVAVEPSFLARTLSSSLMMVITLVYLNPLSKKDFTLYFFILIIFISLMLTASSSAIISLTAISIIMCFFRPVLFLLIAIIFAFLVNYIMLFDQDIYDAIINLTVDKVYTYSYYSRMSTIEEAWYAFLESPFFGDGWESHPAQDVFAKLLGNTGIIGTSLFLFIFVYPIYYSIKLSFSYTDVRCWISRSVSFAIIVVLFVDVFSSLSFVFGFLWVLLGILFFITGDGLKHMELD